MWVINYCGPETWAKKYLPTVRKNRGDGGSRESCSQKDPKIQTVAIDRVQLTSCWVTEKSNQIAEMPEVFQYNL